MLHDPNIVLVQVVFLTPNPVDGQYEAFASEGGHCEYAPRNALERDLLKFLQEKFKGTANSTLF